MRENLRFFRHLFTRLFLAIRDRQDLYLFWFCNRFTDLAKSDIYITKEKDGRTYVYQKLSPEYIVPRFYLESEVGNCNYYGLQIHPLFYKLKPLFKLFSAIAVAPFLVCFTIPLTLFTAYIATYTVVEVSPPLYPQWHAWFYEITYLLIFTLGWLNANTISRRLASYWVARDEELFSNFRAQRRIMIGGMGPLPTLAESLAPSLQVQMQRPFVPEQQDRFHGHVWDEEYQAIFDQLPPYIRQSMGRAYRGKHRICTESKEEFRVRVTQILDTRLDVNDNWPVHHRGLDLWPPEIQEMGKRQKYKIELAEGETPGNQACASWEGKILKVTPNDPAE